MQIRDDRGRAVFVQPKQRGRMTDSMPLVEGLLRAVLFTVFGVVGAVIMFVIIFAFSRWLSTASSWFAAYREVLMIGSVVCGGPAVSSVLAVFFARRRRDEPGSVLSCRACGYSLAKLPQEADGCRVCPECGAAWWASVGEAEHADVRQGERL